MTINKALPEDTLDYHKYIIIKKVHHKKQQNTISFSIKSKNVLLG
jgi:hypothetical protein